MPASRHGQDSGKGLPPRKSHPEGSRAASPPEGVIFLFDREESVREWRGINDVVMGGLSRGDAVWNGRGSLIFTGVISLANGGGFASIRSVPGHYDLTGKKIIVLQCSGDGRRYKLSLRTDTSFDGISWQAEFVAPPGRHEISIPVGELLPTWHGRTVEEAGEFAAAEVRTFGFLIAGGQEGPFELEIASVSSR